jgi:RNA polymerase sigma-70 factor (ECF subfamily)
VAPLQVDLSIYENETALLEGLRSGEADACTCMFKYFAPQMYAQALRMLGDPDEAEGVLQMSFIRACEKIDDFEARSGLGTWLYRITTNEALMRLRKRKQPSSSIDELADTLNPAELPHQTQSWPKTPASSVLDNELRQHLERALQQLPDSLRLVFVLRELEGFSTEETAKTLEIGVSAVKVRLHRARLRLRELLASYLEHGE